MRAFTQALKQSSNLQFELYHGLLNFSLRTYKTKTTHLPVISCICLPLNISTLQLKLKVCSKL